MIRWYQERGYVVGSRRHLKGPADLLTVHPKSGIVGLVECKACKPKQLWQNFRREDREAMKAQPLPPGGERLVVNVISIKNEELSFFGEKSWPESKSTPSSSNSLE